MPDAAAFWDKVADKYAQKPIKDQATYERTLACIRGHLKPGDRVLELGCGTGSTALRLAPSCAHITATDISARMVEIGREKAKAQGVDNIGFEQASVFDERLESRSFDVVMGFNLLHLLEDLEGAIARVHALLKPGGLFISKTVCLAEQTRLWGLVIAAMRPLGLAPYVRSLRVAELEDLMLGAGFEIIDTRLYAKSPPSRLIVARKA